MPEVEIITWDGCYDGNWNDLIVPEAFCHPAKMSRNLARRIFDHLFEIGALKRGDVVCDPFGGVGTTGIEAASRGVQAYLCELEPKFVDLAKKNFALHAHTWEKFGDPQPVIVQGDSRKLRQNLRGVLATACVSSPPFSPPGNQPVKMLGSTQGVRKDYDKRSEEPESTYGESEGQLAAMPMGDVSAVVSSPPYAATAVAKSSTGVNLQKQYDTYRSQGGGASFEAFCATQQKHSGDYGSSDGQLSKLPAGEVSAVVCSPPFSDPGSQPAGSMPSTPVRSKQKAMGVEKKAGEEYGATPGQLGQLKVGDVNAVVCSPPFCDGGMGDSRPGGGLKDQSLISASKTGGGGKTAYGDTDGQLSTMKVGEISAVVCSPPFSDRQPASNARPSEEVKLSTIEADTYGQSDGQLGTMPIGELDSIVTSPPYASNTVHGESGIDQSKLSGNTAGKNSQARKMDGYGEQPGNLGGLPEGAVASIITSPPYAECLQGDNTARETAEESRAKRVTEGGSLGQSQRHSGYGSAENLGNLKAGTVDAVATSPPFEASDQRGADREYDFTRADGKAFGKGQSMIGYPASDGQLGQETGQTFWAAARDIVRESYLILKPGGWSCWVVKRFVRDGAVVDFPGDWCKLLESQGFVVTTIVRAMLVKHETQPGLFDETVTKTKKRSSFFRKIYEKKYPHNAIDFEEVVFARKPCES